MIMESPGNPLFRRQETVRATMAAGSEALLMTSVAEAAASENAPPITCSSRDSITKVISENPSSAIEIPVSLSCDKPDSSGSLLDEIDAGIDGIRRNCSWKAELRFPLYYCNPNEPLPSDSSQYAMLDLFQLTEKVRGLGGMIARLDPSKYPVVPGGMKQNKATWTKLSTDIMSESKSVGKSLLVSNGSHGTDRMALVCSRYKRYEEKARRPKAGGKLRLCSINCDRNNAQKGNGKHEKKRTSTSKALPGSDETTCKAKLLFGIDSRSFYLVCGNGENVHTGHSLLSSEEMPTRKRTVPEQATTVAKQLANRGARPGLIAGVLKDQFDVDLTRRQVAQTTEMAKLASNLIDTEHLQMYKHCMSDTD